MDLAERAIQLKPMLMEFALSSRFEDELAGVLGEYFPSGVSTGTPAFAAVLDHFALEHQLATGGTVVEAFVTAHPELAAAERDMLLSWRDVVDGIFDIEGTDDGLLLLTSAVDERPYRARSALGPGAFEPVEKGMVAVTRLVRAGEDWLISGDLAVYPASARDQLLAAAG